MNRILSPSAAQAAPHVEGGYRADVDGLRAVAVLSVLAFHAFPTALPGGFVGVDVFFVISGFLISGIILGELQSDRFTFANFYSRRIRRIFPALGLVLLATLGFGWLMLLPFDFATLGRHIGAGAAFASNLLLWHEAGDYFDSEAAFKPLLHLWSLGVEEQYYILWPMLLFVLRRHVHRVFWLIVVIAVASFVANVISVPRHPNAFYLPHIRFWELMLGSAIAYARLYRAGAIDWLAGRELTAVVGAASLIAALLLIDAQAIFPGWWALLPTVGTALLICAGPRTWINSRVLANPVAVFVGLISYPLYLWHWPLLTYARILEDAPPAGLRVGLLIASGVLAWLTYVLLEKKVRHPGSAEQRRWVVALLAASVTAVAACGVLAATDRLSARSASIHYLSQISAAVHDWKGINDRDFPGESPRAVMFFGDSHMQQFLPRIELVARQHTSPTRTVIIRTRGGCAPVPHIERRGYGCDRFVRDAFATANASNVDTVVLAASWLGFLGREDYRRAGEQYSKPLKLGAPDSQWVWDGFEAQLKVLIANGKHVVIILSTPRDPLFNPTLMAARDGLGFKVRIPPDASMQSVALWTADVDARLKTIAERVGATWLDPLPWICRGGMCSALDEKGQPLFKDGTHLRASIARERITALDRFVYVGSEGR